MAVGARSWFINSWRISHLGRNPVRGGRPPRESRISGVSEVRTGAFVHEIASMLMVVELFNLKATKVENVITKYVRRARRVKEGMNCTTSIIQPRWAIEE